MTPTERARLTAQPRRGHGQWTREGMLLALIADRIAHQTWVLGQWKQQPPRPKPIPRPGVEDAHAKPNTVTELQESAHPAAWAAAEAMRASMRTRQTREGGGDDG